MNKYLTTPYAAETKKFRDIPGNIVLSPSSIGKFYNDSKEWWDDRNGIINFDGNSNTVLGNAVHAAIEAHYQGDEVTTDDVEEWVESWYGSNEKVDPDMIKKQFLPMFNAWKRGYLTMYPPPDVNEHGVSMKIQENMLMAGTMDGYEEERGVIIDWKTCKQKPSDKDVDKYKFQMLAYAQMMIANGHDVQSYRIVFIQQELKTLPARVWIFNRDIEEEDLVEIIRLTELMKDCVNTVQKNPEMERLIFRNNPLAKW